MTSSTLIARTPRLPRRAVVAACALATILFAGAVLQQVDVGDPPTPRTDEPTAVVDPTGLGAALAVQPLGSSDVG